MHSNIERSARTFTSNMSGWRHHVAGVTERIGTLLKRASVKHYFSRQSAHKALPVVGIIAGAAACALWVSSPAAGVFALILLFLLSNIGKSLHRIAAVLKNHTAANPSLRPSTLETAEQRNIYISSKAMERLRPWVEDKGSLTEESAKAYCSVLLDTMAIVQPRLAGR